MPCACEHEPNLRQLAGYVYCLVFVAAHIPERLLPGHFRSVARKVLLSIVADGRVYSRTRYTHATTRNARTHNNHIPRATDGALYRLRYPYFLLLLLLLLLQASRVAAHVQVVPLRVLGRRPRPCRHPPRTSLFPRPSAFGTSQHDTWHTHHRTHSHARKRMHHHAHITPCSQVTLIIQPTLLPNQQDDMAAIRGSADYLLDLLRREGNVPMCRAYQHHTYTHNLCWRITHTKAALCGSCADGDKGRVNPVQWCHGAPGSTALDATMLLCVCYTCLTLTWRVRACVFVPLPVVALFCRLHELTRESKYLAAARAAADCTWREGLLKKSISLCHGAVGNAYAHRRRCVCVMCCCWCATLAVHFLKCMVRQVRVPDVAPAHAGGGVPAAGTRVCAVVPHVPARRPPPARLPLFPLWYALPTANSLFFFFCFLCI